LPNLLIKNMEKTKQVKLGEIFEVEGKLYAIQIPNTPSTESSLSDGRNIYEFFYMSEE
jgi:hypothetical protein